MNASQRFIVWDWNGTVVADEEAAFKAFNETLLFRKKLPLTMEDWREAFDMPPQQLYRNVGFSEEELNSHLMVMSEVFHKSFEKFSKESQLRHGWREAISIFGKRSFDNIILSNHLVSSIRQTALRLGITDLCDHILAHDNIVEQLSQRPKSHRLRTHIEKNRLVARNALIVGDTPEEASIGRQLGIVSVLISGGYATQKRLEAAEPNYLIHSFDELYPILHEIGFAS